MADSVKTFQSHLTSVMDSLIRASVCEISKLFQDTVNDYLVEISLNRKENEALKLRLRLTENKLRNERKYGMGWAASRRTSGLLVADDSGRKKRRAEVPRVKQRDGGFGKDWAGSPWGAAGPGGAGQGPREVFLVQLHGGVEEELREEATDIKEESTEPEGGYRPESLRLIQEALQMDPADQNLGPGPRVHVEGAVEAGPGLPSGGQRAPEDPGQQQQQQQEEEEGGGAEAEGEGFGEQRLCAGAGLNGLEAELKAEPKAVGGGDVGHVVGGLVERYIGLDGMCSSERDAASDLPDPESASASACASAQTAERAADGLLGFGWARPGREGRGEAGVGLAPFPGPAMGLGELEDQDQSCGVCGKTFLQPAHLQAHMLRLHGGETGPERPHRCTACGRSFAQPWGLKSHECAGERLAERPHRCPLCGKRFTHSRSLERHQLVHTGERPHRCPQCGRSFSRLGNLERHQRIHTGERPYACAHCGKRFSRVEYLKRHQLIHSGERDHQPIHGGERPAHQCLQCGMAFSEPELLKNHPCIYSI
ncbi:zinc finger protein 696-like [Conger conger]|uniref:zinc finger protein 696-like n=1 Tax=Conger conger TaxID=82655 RepID=UPI002A598828|nr:zinc finger protein 696-like [Conger conger]